MSRGDASCRTDGQRRLRWAGRDAQPGSPAPHTRPARAPAPSSLLRAPRAPSWASTGPPSQHVDCAPRVHPQPRQQALTEPPAPRPRELRPLGPAHGHRVGEAEHRGLRGGPRQHHHLRGISWSCQRLSAGLGTPGGQGLSPRLWEGADRGRGGQGRSCGPGPSSGRRGEALATGPLCVPQTLSPYNKGLIRRAISQSGVALSPWAIQKNPLLWAKRVGRSCSGRGRGSA